MNEGDEAQAPNLSHRSNTLKSMSSSHMICRRILNLMLILNEEEGEDEDRIPQYPSVSLKVFFYFVSRVHNQLVIYVHV